MVASIIASTCTFLKKLSNNITFFLGTCDLYLKYVSDMHNSIRYRFKKGQCDDLYLLPLMLITFI